MHHTRQGTIGRDTTQDSGKSRPVAHIARHHVDGGSAEAEEFGPQSGGAVGSGAAAAGQHEVPDAMAGDEVAAEQSAQRAGSAGDQDGSVRIERASGRRGGRRRRCSRRTR
jgi:hypothetical protein